MYYVLTVGKYRVRPTALNCVLILPVQSNGKAKCVALNVKMCHIYFDII